MRPPDIGKKLLARFSSVKDENITLIRHGGWINTDGTFEELATTEVPFIVDGLPAQGQFYFGPVPSNMTVDADITGNEMSEAKWLWCTIAVSRGLHDVEADARGADKVRDNNTGKVYEVRSVLDPHRSQSGLYGALLTLSE